MMHPLDDDLFAALAETATVLGPPTGRERAAAQPARDLLGATRGYDLAELAFDSLLDEAVTVRGPGLAGSRELVFDADEATLRLEVGADLLRCRVEPAAEASLALTTSRGESIPFRSRGGGVYELADPPSGAARLELRSAAAHLATSWIHL
ncbi:MAG TPA: hypothetical protein VFU35_13085 [Jatrophihabitans sp.]|nr:hypothetical protein [Jatrophihabitans sp.]